MQRYWFADIPKQEWPGASSDSSDVYDELWSEGFAAFFDLSFSIVQPTLWVDVGGGFSDNTKFYMEDRFHPWLVFHVIDPYNRSHLHNRYVQHQVELKGGADYVSSISVVNILESDEVILNHLQLLHTILKPGGTAIIKIWDGNLTEGGERQLHLKRGIPQDHSNHRHHTVFQWGKPASFFEPLVQQVFTEYVIRDETCIIATKSTTCNDSVLSL